MSCRPNQCNPLAERAISHSFRTQGDPNRCSVWNEFGGADVLAYRQPVGARQIVLEFLQEWNAVAERSRVFASEIEG
jgi:hypothetical protein